MVVTGDISNYFYTQLASFAIPIYQRGNIPEGEVTSERITIYAMELTSERIWQKCYVNINFEVPDLKDRADLVRLQALEQSAKTFFEDKSFTMNSNMCSYTLDSLSIEEDKPLRCHYVNARILFKILNVN